MTSMQMKRGDLEPNLVLVVEDQGGLADFSNVESWRIVGKLHGNIIVNGAPTSVVVDPENSSKATLTRAWVAGETDTVGVMQVEVKATWPGTRKQTFPANSYAAVRFLPDLS